jgi:PAS domain S-box-containing protein
LSFFCNALINNESRFQTIVQSLPQIAWTINLEAEADFFNQRWYDYTGLTYEQTRGWGWQKVIHPDDLQKAMEACKKIRESAEAADIETRYKRADGVYRWHLTRLEPIKGEQGKIEYWIGSSTDVEELKQLQQLKDDFVGIASHELKTPITSLKALLQLLQQLTRSDPASKKIPMLANSANISMDKLIELLEDLINFSKIQNGQLALKKVWFNLSKLINECCEHVRLDSLHHITFVGSKKLMVFADRGRIDQVIVNLVNNAVKYAPNAEKIIITIEKDESNVKVSVRDFGIGISAEKIPHLFDRYFRAEPSDLQSTGLGLGLYISAEIIKRHSGQIGVKSKLGKGSTFWFTLPLS